MSRAVGTLTGRAVGRFTGWSDGGPVHVHIGLCGTLRPRRTIDVTQLDRHGKPLGGVTIEVVIQEPHRRGDH